MAQEKRTWTAEQEAAINTRDKTLLVSAAAGSGKTATLTERIIRSVLDEKQPISIKDMLIVTFTNSAVGELRDRISAAIKKAATENPDNFRLEEELLTVRDARIMTIDAFCNSILKSCAASVGLPPNYRIGDEAELALLSSSIMDGLINACYEGEIPEIATAKEFAYLAECLTTARGEGGLSDVLLELYRKTESTEAGIDSLLPLVEEYNPDTFTSVDETRFGKYIKDEVMGAFTSYKRAYRLIEHMAIGDDRDVKAYAKLLPDKEAIEKILASKSFGKMRENILSFTLASMQGLRGEKSDAYIRLECIRGILKTDLERFKTSYFAYDTGEWKDLYSRLYSTLSILLRTLKKFDELFAREKKNRGICSYGDIERYAYSALWKDGEKTPYAKELAASFKAVYIDEYQDVNNLQNKIFEAVSTEDNRFMVGDIKQSIYGFRSARPEIFAEMKKSYPKLENGSSSTAASLFMSANFRCDEEIVYFTNGIFNKMFGVLGENIGYEEGDALVFSKIYREGESPKHNIPEIHLIEKAAGNTDYSARSDSAIADEVLAEDEEAINLAASEVADRIAELLKNGIKANGEHFAPSDIAVIMRSAKGRAEKYRLALAKKGISASVADNKEFLMSEEVLLALALLNTIDNPRRDIYLAALLMSPLFGFTPDDMVLIRKCSSSETLYEALCEYCGLHPDFQKGQRFLSDLSRFRSIAEGINIDSLLSLLYRETGLLPLAERCGGKDNLMLLQSYAKNYESSSYKGLYSFISYINNIINENKKFDTGAGSAEDENTVKIITAHKSKGLEFPACFFVESDVAIRKSSAERIAYAEDFGLSMLLKDPSGISLVSNPAQNVINRFNSEKEYEEELRILYVILTRAREALFVFGTASSVKYQEKLDSIKILGEELDGYLATKFRSMFEIIEATRNCGRFFLHQLSENEEAEDDETPAAELPEALSLGESETKKIRKDADELLLRFNFAYPHKHLERLPEKLSVSKLYPEILDGTEISEIALENLLDSIKATATDNIRDDFDDSFKPYLPKFITGIEADESAKCGIATHTFMQFCDFNALSENGARSELERLVKGQFISHDDMERVRINEIESFISSPLFDEMKNAKKLHRELRFNVKFPAAIFTADEELRAAISGEELLVQGVIDCVIERSDGSLHLVDYKTDRLTKEERLNKSLGREKLLKAHSLQLSYYKMAVESIFGKAPEKIGIYSLHLGEEVEIKDITLP